MNEKEKKKPREEDDEDFDDVKESGGPPIFVTKEFLSRYYHMPIAAAAKELGVCTTMLKKMCRHSGVQRWPFRRVCVLSFEKIPCIAFSK